MDNNTFWKVIRLRVKIARMQLARWVGGPLEPVDEAPETGACTGRDLGFFVSSLVRLADHDRRCHKKPESVPISINHAIDCIIWDLASPSSRRGKHMHQAIAIAVAAAGYDPDDDYLGDPENWPAVPVADRGFGDHNGR